MTAPSSPDAVPHDETRRATRGTGLVGAARWSALLLMAASAITAACKTTGAVVAPAVRPAAAVPLAPAITWQQKIGWIVRLEDQRILRDPSPPAPAVIRPATATAPAVLALPAPSDLIRLLDDSEPRIRARAALAIGRVGLPEGIEPLSHALEDANADVRQTAAFALGLIGGGAGRPALLKALTETSPLVQGRAAEALGLIGDRSDADAVAQMVRGHATAVANVAADDLTFPQVPEAEAARLGIYALVRLGSYAALASAVLDAQGQPISRWWPVSYALQRIGDARANPALLTLLKTPGRYTAAFAARGLSRMPSPEAIAALSQIVERRQASPAVVIAAIRSLGAAGATAAVPVLMKIIGDPAADTAVQEEAMTAFGTLAGRQHLDVVIDLLTHRSAFMRAAAVRALERIDQDVLLSALASLDLDPDWTVRVAQAQALGALSARRGEPRLRSMLADSDVRVIPAVLAALVTCGAPGIETIATARLADRDFVIRTAAANALADGKVVGAVPALVTAYRASAADPEYGARAAILAAIVKLDPQTARPLLEEALQDRDWAVRVRAAALLKEQNAATEQTAARMRPAVAGVDVMSADWQAVVAPPYAPLAVIDTTKGTIEIELAVSDAPLTVRNFMTLARRGFFDGRTVHRVVRDLVVQDGDPRGDSEGGPGYTIRDELNERPYLRGTVGMALDWKDTGGSQFFITHSPQPHLDARYTVFGQVVSGMEVVDRLSTTDVIQRVRINDGVSPE
jgi:cyclophilin family peptidyl-prolyl cis-trans isomerase/HEAT repeat protein